MRTTTLVATILSTSALLPAAVLGATPAVSTAPADGAIIPAFTPITFGWTLPATTPGSPPLRPTVESSRVGPVFRALDLTGAVDIKDAAGNLTGIRQKYWDPAGTYRWRTSIGDAVSADRTLTIKAAHQVMVLTARPSTFGLLVTSKMRSNVEGFTVTTSVLAAGRLASRNVSKPTDALRFSNDPVVVAKTRGCAVCLANSRKGQSTKVVVKVLMSGGGVTASKSVTLTYR